MKPTCSYQPDGEAGCFRATAWPRALEFDHWATLAGAWLAWSTLNDASARWSVMISWFSRMPLIGIRRLVASMEDLP